MSQFDREVSIGDPDDPTTPGFSSGAEPPPPEGEGFALTPAMAILMGGAASSLISGVMAQRNAREQRKFAAEQADKTREFTREERRRQNILGSVSGMGQRATQSATAQSSALSRLAQLFGGL